MDLTTSYMGMTLKNPVVPSASPLTENLDNFKRMEDAGAAAVVMHSLFEEQITSESRQLDHFLSFGVDSFAEALSYFPEMESYRLGPDEYLNLIRRAKETTEFPIIGSLNGVSTGGWVEFARKIQQAGADALELNVYYIPTNPKVNAFDVEQIYLDILRDVKKNVSIPVAVKLSPFFSATANIAGRLSEAKVDALVMFNRFYQPDFDLDELEVVPHLRLSNAHEFLLPLRWVAILYGRVEADMAITSGVHSHLEVLKGMMAGAKVVMLASELLKNGIGRISDILADTQEWMEKNEYESITQMQGSMSQKAVTEPAAFERANYMKVLQSWRPDPSGEAFKTVRI